METAYLREWFVYEERGTLRCLIPGRDPYPWLPIGSNLSYLAGNFGREKCYLHRLVWQFHYDIVPPKIDHHDRNTRNNRVGNLRACSHAQNQYNSKMKINNRSGAKGVVAVKGYRKPWKAKITVDKVIITLGYFDTVEEAGAAYDKAALHYAKEFALLNK